MRGSAVAAAAADAGGREERGGGGGWRWSQGMQGSGGRAASAPTACRYRLNLLPLAQMARG